MHTPASTPASTPSLVSTLTSTHVPTLLLFRSIFLVKTSKFREMLLDSFMS